MSRQAVLAPVALVADDLDMRTLPSRAVRVAQAAGAFTEAELLSEQYPSAHVAPARLARGRGEGMSATVAGATVTGRLTEVRDWLAENCPGALMATGEVAALFGVDPRTVRRWAARGVLEAAARTPGSYHRSQAEALAAQWEACRDWPKASGAARALGVSRRSVWRWASAGRLAGAVLAIDGDWRVPPATLEAILAGATPKAPAGEGGPGPSPAGQDG